MHTRHSHPPPGRRHSTLTSAHIAVLTTLWRTGQDRERNPYLAEEGLQATLRIPGIHALLRDLVAWGFVRCVRERWYGTTEFGDATASMMSAGQLSA